MPDLRLSWGDYPGGYGTEVTGPATIDTGGVAVTVGYTNIAESATAFTLSLDSYDDPLDDLPPNSQLKLISDGGVSGATSQTVLSFASTDPLYGDTVSDLSFRLDDIDAGTLADIDGGPGDFHDDMVSITAYDAAGNAIPVSITAGAGMTVTGQTLDGDTQGLPTDAAQSALVSIAGPVARVEINYANNGTGEQEIFVSDLLFSTTDPSDPANIAPVAVDDSASTLVDTLLEDIDVLGNDSDADGDPLTVTAASSADGTVSINGDGTLNFDPAPGFVGATTISYTIDDGNGGTDIGSVAVTVTAGGGGNTPPVATDDSASTPFDTLLEDIDVLGNDTDADGDALSVTAASSPDGTVTINGDGTLNFDPTPGFSGPATISYTIDDGNGGTDIGSVAVTVDVDPAPPTPGNTAPVALNDRLDAPTGVLVEDIDVLGNDSDADGDALTVTSATSPNGTVTINADGTLDYQSNPGFEGTDLITYTVDDGNGGTDTAIVRVSVRDTGGGNQAPVLGDDIAATPVDTLLEDIDVLANDSDPDGDPLTVVAATAPNGTVTINPDNTLDYQPAPGFLGTDTITYTVDDGNGATVSAAVTVTVGTTPLDGIVEGTAGDDLIIADDPTTPGINEAYLGDPEGDQIDNSDAILPGQAPQDDIVEAGPGDDTIDSGLGDDYVDADLGDDVVITGVGDDTVVGDGGDDDIDTGTGDDSVIAGDGDDTVVTGDGRDTVEGGTGDDVIDTSGSSPLIDAVTFPSIPVDPDPDDDRDLVDGGLGDDLIITGDDADTVFGGEGDDTIFAGIDDDRIVGGGGDDSIFDVQGADFVDGGDGDDTINVGVDTYSDYIGDDPNLPLVDGGVTFVTDPNTDDGRDTVLGGAGNDIINTGDDADTIDGGAGDDTINAGIDDDLVRGGDGDDSILGGHGSDTISGGAGDDYIDAGLTGTPRYTGDIPDDLELPGLELNDRDFVTGGAGNDTIFGGDDADSISGGAGDDYIDGGIDNDTIAGDRGDDIIFGGDGDDVIASGIGNDTVTGGEGADSIFTGAGEDSIIGATAGDTVDGGSGPVDFDTLNLTSASLAQQALGGRIDVTYTSADQEDGFVRFLDAADVETGRMTFEDIERVIPCFTPGTMIATPTGERAVEDLVVGDRVITRDNGIQEIRWTGAKALTGAQLAANAHLQPVLIRAGALGGGMPERDILVSPQHRMLLTTDQAAMYFEEREVLVAAKHLTMLDGVDIVESSGTTYIHMMFEHHEVVLSNGTWSESFQPGDYTLDGIGAEQRAEILELFPELATQKGVNAYQSARRALKKYEAELLLG